MINNKVVWHEGMFLCPQHFQQQERYFESFVRELVGELSQGSFGFSELMIDYSLAKIGKINLRRAKGIFPDGTPFTTNKELILDVPKNIKNKYVYLALPIARTGMPNVGSDSNRRYRQMEAEIVDSTREQSESVSLDVAQLNLSLRIEGEDQRDYALLPIMLVQEYHSTNALVINSNFIPPCLQFGVSRYLTEAVTELYAHMQYRAKTIHTRLQADVENKSQQALLRDYLWLKTLGEWLPKVQNWHQEQSLAAKTLYLESLSLVGQLQGLEGRMPTEFSGWTPNPADLYHNFSKLFAEAFMLLREVQIENIVTLIWNTNLFSSRRLLRTSIQDRSLYNHSRFILVVTSATSTALGKDFINASKLAGNSAIAELVRNGLSGIGLRLLPYAPAELKARNDAAYFELDTQSPFWQEIIDKNDPIALHVDERIIDVNVEFFAIR